MATGQDLHTKTLFRVEDIVAVVTGSATGIGLMAAQALVSNGARVYMISQRQDILRKAVDAINAENSNEGKAIPMPADISFTDDRRKLVSQLTSLEPGGINILINNGSVASEIRARSETHDVNFGDPTAVSKWMTIDGPDAWNDAFTGNITAHHFLTAALLPLLHKGRLQTRSHSSAIVNVSSASGLTKTHSHGQFAFSSAKSAFIHLTKEWAHSFLPLQVRVNCIAPGVFPHISPGEGVKDETQRERLEKLGIEIPASRPGEDIDIAGAVLYLCSTAGAYVNGQVLHVDGGILLKTPSTA